MSTYILSDQALRDLDEIVTFIVNRNPSAVVPFVDAVIECCSRLAQFPGMGRKRYELLPNMRSFPVGDYLLFYQPNPVGIEIVRVISGYMDLDNQFASSPQE